MFEIRGPRKNVSREFHFETEQLGEMTRSACTLFHHWLSQRKAQRQFLFSPPLPRKLQKIVTFR